MRRSEIIELDRKHIRRKKTFPFVMGDATGCEIIDVNGKHYLDFIAGLYGTVNIGWKQKNVLDTMRRQMELFNFAPDRCPSEICSKLAKLLTDNTPKNLTVCLRATSGSEAVDLAIKAARSLSSRKRIIAFTSAYHGQTLGALSVGDKKSVKRKVSPLIPLVSRAHFPYCYRCKYSDNCSNECLGEVENLIKRNKDYCGLIIEPIQGTGAIVPPSEYLKKLKEICEKNSILFILDEVITGFGRTGELFAADHYKIKPDIMVLGKGLSSGYAPIATTIVSEEVSEALGPSGNTSTLGWNPICAAAAYASVQFTLKKKLPSRAKRLGKRLSKQMLELENHFSVGETRNVGLFGGIELVTNKKTKQPATQLTEKIYNKCLEKGLYLAVDGISENTLMLIPPLTISEKQLDYGISVISRALQNKQK